MIGLAVACAGVAGCPSGWKLEAVDGAQPSITNTTWLSIDCTKRTLQTASDPLWHKRLRPHVHCAGAKTDAEQSLCTTAPGARSTPTVTHPGDLVSLLSFVHLSDAQLKEHQIHIEGPLGNETTYDGIKSTSSRDRLLEQNDDAALLATILSINEMKTLFPLQQEKGMKYAGYAPPAPPRFVIHTGDSVDAGMFSELLQFLAVMDQLDVPYYNAIGNHDNLFFGTLPGDLMSGLNVVSPYVPIITTERFMRYHSLGGREQDVTLPYPAARGDDHDATAKPAPGSGMPKSSFHGFDLVCKGEPAPHLLNSAGLAADKNFSPLCNKARGYYTLDLELAKQVDGTRKVKIIVLNTAQVLPESVGTAFSRMSKGNMLPEQMRWLKAQLAEGGAGGPFFLVLGHHNLDSFVDEAQAEELRGLLLRQPRVLGYIAAHTHVDDIKQWPREAGPPLWEIIGGSTLVYPQLGRLIELLEAPDDKRIVMRVLSFRQVFGDAADELRSLPAEDCPTPTEGQCGGLLPRDYSFCQRLADRASFARTGAARDNDEDRRDEPDAVSRINGVMPVYEMRGRAR